jgi:hypothetical protein
LLLLNELIPKKEGEMVQTTARTNRFHTISTASVNDDGTASFRIQRHDGQYLDISVSVQDIGDIFAFILGIARALPSGATGVTFQTEAKSTVSAILTDGIGIAAPSPDHSMIIFKIGNFPLAFLVPNTALAQFGADLAQKVQALSATRAQRN